MKKFSFFFILIFLQFAQAQQFEVNYTAIVRKTLPDEVRQEFLKDNLREQLKQNEEPDPCQYQLLISDKESSFTNIEKISNNQDSNAAVMRVAPAGFGTTYKDLNNSTWRSNYNVCDKKYFSVDPLEKFDWKITKEKKEIMGFEVRKATAEDSTAVYTAWYAPKLAVSTGPATYWGLPGLILELEKSSKTMVYNEKYLAESIEIPKKKIKIIKPNQGTQIHANQIDDIFQEVNDRRNQMWNDAQAVDKD